MRPIWLLLPVATLALLAVAPPRADACSCRDDRGGPTFLALPQSGERDVPCDTLLVVQSSTRLEAVKVGTAAPPPPPPRAPGRPGRATRGTAFNRSPTSTVVLTQAGALVPIRSDEDVEGEGLRTQLFRPLAPLRPGTEYQVHWSLQGTYDQARETVTFHTGACRAAGRVPPPTGLSVKVKAPDMPGPSCGTGHASARLTFRPARVGKAAVRLYALHQSAGALDWRKPSAYLLTTAGEGWNVTEDGGRVTVWLGWPSTCSMNATGHLPVGPGVRFGLRAVGMNGARSSGVPVGPVRVPAPIRK